jgi:deazaflavin-dependent oxidoreductase (nitroreductase family)
MSSSSPPPNSASSTAPRHAPAPVRWAMRLAIGLYRRSSGRIGGHVAGTSVLVLLLTTTGRRSGKAITRPLGYFDYDGVRYVVAANSGAPADPAWYRNLLAHPAVTVEVGRERYQAVAMPATGEERARLWEHTVAVAPAYGRYARGPREIPVVVLRRSA